MDNRVHPTSASKPQCLVLASGSSCRYPSPAVSCIKLRRANPAANMHYSTELRHLSQSHFLSCMRSHLTSCLLRVLTSSLLKSPLDYMLRRSSGFTLNSPPPCIMFLVLKMPTRPCLSEAACQVIVFTILLQCCPMSPRLSSRQLRTCANVVTLSAKCNSPVFWGYSYGKVDGDGRKLPLRIRIPSAF
jgi:hypothetical protein